MARELVSDELWKRIEPLFPAHPPRPKGGRRRIDDRRGLDEFLAILKADRHWNEGQARKRLVAAFNVLDDEELVGNYRRRMSSLLF